VNSTVEEPKHRLLRTNCNIAGHLNDKKQNGYEGTFFRFALLFAVTACNNSRNSDVEMKDPSTVQPPSEAITDSTKLVNDSVIMPDTQPRNGHQV